MNTTRPVDVDHELLHGDIPLCVRVYIRDLERQLHQARAAHEFELSKNRTLTERLRALGGRSA
jgi:hypothetical protein